MDIHTAGAPPELVQELRDNLNEGEELLWIGRPQQGIMFRYEDILAVPFSIVWALGPAISVTIVLTMTDAAATSDIGLVLTMCVICVAFLVMGSYLLFGRFIADKRRRANTIYAVTNCRALILSGVIKRWQRSVKLEKLSRIFTIPYWGNRKTIKLGPAPFPAISGLHIAFLERFRWPEFEKLEDGDSVLSIIERARKGLGHE